MTALTRRRKDDRLETWEIFYGDLSVGKISKLEPDPVRPKSAWRLSCGLYLGSQPIESNAGTEQTCEAARDNWQAT